MMTLVRETKQQALRQYFTPRWAAEAVVETIIKPSPGSYVVEPSCGPGAFIHAMPSSIDVIGVEIDADLAEQARKSTGRQVITGDFREVDVPGSADWIFGNPPFELRVIDGMLIKARSVLKKTVGKVGWILPCYILQTPRNVIRWNETWAMETIMIPRTLFPGLSTPLCFVTFFLDRQVLGNLALYEEAQAIENMPETYGDALKASDRSGSVWRHVVETALIALGGTASLKALYGEVAPRRPTRNTFWKEQIRKVLRTHFLRVKPGVYTLKQQA